jgi:hypothetical protein
MKSPLRRETVKKSTAPACSVRSIVTPEDKTLEDRPDGAALEGTGKRCTDPTSTLNVTARVAKAVRIGSDGLFIHETTVFVSILPGEGGTCRSEQGYSVPEEQGVLDHWRTSLGVGAEKTNAVGASGEELARYLENDGALLCPMQPHAMPHPASIHRHNFDLVLWEGMGISEIEDQDEAVSPRGELDAFRLPVESLYPVCHWGQIDEFHSTPWPGKASYLPLQHGRLDP